MKGVYYLLIELKSDAVIRVGALGEMRFFKGYYAYVGSALNNLNKRVERHCRKNKKMHWHIDYLTTEKSASIAGVFCKETSIKEDECRTADYLKELGEPLAGFGCSDCRCESHLFRLKTSPELLLQEISKKLSGIGLSILPPVLS